MYDIIHFVKIRCKSIFLMIAFNQKGKRIMKKTFKKIAVAVMVAITLAFGSVGHYGTFAFAGNIEDGQANIDIVNLSSNISEDEIQEITANVSANLVYKDGSEVPVDTIVTIEDVSTVNSKTRTMFNETDSKSYKVTVSASANTDNNSNTNSSRKIDSDSADKNTSKVVASATLQLIWTDKSGLNNVLNTVSGTKTVTKGSVSSATLKYGDGSRSSILWTTKNVKYMNSFSYTPNITAADPSASYSIVFNESSIALSLSVSSSIFQ